MKSLQYSIIYSLVKHDINKKNAVWYMYLWSGKPSKRPSKRPLNIFLKKSVLLLNAIPDINMYNFQSIRNKDEDGREGKGMIVKLSSQQISNVKWWYMGE